MSAESFPLDAARLIYTWTILPAKFPERALDLDHIWCKLAPVCTATDL